MKKKRVYIAAPISGNPEANCVEALKFSETVRDWFDCYTVDFPFYCVLRGWLDEGDPDERRIGIQIDQKLLLKCDELRFLPGRISNGMRNEIDYAMFHKIPVYEGMSDVEFTD